jgi:hypothetical protein
MRADGGSVRWSVARKLAVATVLHNEEESKGGFRCLCFLIEEIETG